SERARSASLAPESAKWAETTRPSTPVAPVITITRSAIVLPSPALAQLAGEHVHQEPVVEFARGAALISTHHADGPEAHLLVGPDGACVGGRGIDRQSVVAALVEQPPRDRPNGIGAEAATLERRRQEDVDAGVPVVRVVLLARLDAAGERPIYLDRPHEPIQFPSEQLVRAVLRPAGVPPFDDAGVGQHADQR